MDKRAANANEASLAPQRYQLTFKENVIAGGFAGIVECIIMYPLDVVKTLQQLKLGKIDGTFKMLFDIIRTERFRTYRGIATPLFTEAPKRAIKFSSNAYFKRVFTDAQNAMTVPRATIAGCFSGLTEAFMIVPFELVKIRLQDRSNMSRYANTADAIYKIARYEGPLTFYRGLEGTLWRNGVWNSAYFGLIHYLNHNRSPVGEEWKTGWRLSVKNFGIGTTSGIVAVALNTPFDVVKSRIQNQSGPTSWTWPSLINVYRTEGISALWKGFVPKVLRLGPGGGVLLVVQQSIANMFINRYNVAQGLV